MRLRVLSIALLGLLAAGVCARLGAWQLARLGEKRALNAAMRAGLEAPPLALASGATLPDDSSLVRRVVEARGRWDRERELLVAGGLVREVPVAHLVLPLVLGSGEAVLVDRGTLPAEEASAADLSRYADSGLVTVRGWAEPMRRGAGPPGPRSLAPAPGTSRLRLSARALDAESLAARLPYRIAGVVLRELPAAGAPAGLGRRPPAALDENVHLGYAVQWFAIAAVVLGGAAMLAARERRR